MKPTLAIGDVHGCTYWQQAVSDHPDRHVVFLGDYLDPYDYVPRKQLLANLQRIVELKLRRPHDVTLLLGNHDLHYFDDNALLGSRFDWQLKPLAQALFTELRSLFCYAYQDGNRLFTHAGVAHRWFVDDFGGNPLLPVSPQLNRPSSAAVGRPFPRGCGKRRAARHDRRNLLGRHQRIVRPPARLHPGGRPQPCTSSNRTRRSTPAVASSSATVSRTSSTRLLTKEQELGTMG